MPETNAMKYEVLIDMLEKYDIKLRKHGIVYEVEVVHKETKLVTKGFNEEEFVALTDALLTNSNVRYYNKNLSNG